MKEVDEVMVEVWYMQKGYIPKKGKNAGHIITVHFQLYGYIRRNG